MSLPRVFVVVIVLLFLFIGVFGWLKKDRRPKAYELLDHQLSSEEIEFSEEHLTIATRPITTTKTENIMLSIGQDRFEISTLRDMKQLPDANRIEALFDPAAEKLPIIETVTYSSRVPWLKGRPAWLADYAAHYHTSRHFIARSLNGKQDYYSQNLVNGDRFNVIKPDANIQFHLLIDASRCRLWFYYHDLDLNEKILLKTYDVGLGRIDTSKASGMLTPLGRYSLGDKIAVYRPGIMGFFNNQKTEMIQIFGTRWIPFEKELNACTAPSKGLGIHGAPWTVDLETGKWIEDLSGINNYASDGCIRLRQMDMEEIFSIIVTKFTMVELVKDFFDTEI